jgi:hypothetical protein
MKRTSARRRRGTGVVWLLACLVAIGLWARSFWCVDVVSLRRDGGGGGASSLPNGIIIADGAVMVIELHVDRRAGGLVAYSGGDVLRGREHLHLAASGTPKWRRPGRMAPTGLGVGGWESMMSRGWALPLWILTAAVACIPPALTYPRKWVRQRRSTAGKCPSCGYDLRATPERCPECGTIPTR